VPKLGVFSGEEICRILETEGFLRVRQKGSHTILRNSSRRLGVGSALIHFPVGGGMVQIDWRRIALRDLVRRSPRRPAKIAISSPTAESKIPTAGHLRNKSERSGHNGIKNSESVTSSCSRLVTSRYLAPSLVRGPDI
jgi:hypothetical protein